MFFGPQKFEKWARGVVELPRIQCGGCSTIELGRVLAYCHHAGHWT
jgi:hypothetical protein